MADESVAAKREARRRRILLNSQARLEKITGRPANGLHGNPIPDSEFNNGSINGENFGASEPSTSFSPLLDENSFVQHKVASSSWGNNLEENHTIHSKDNLKEKHSKYCWQDDSATVQASTSQTHNTENTSLKEMQVEIMPPKHTFLFVITSLKCHLVLLAIIVRLFHYINVGFAFGENIFIPFFIVELSHLLLLKLTKRAGVETGMIGAVLLLSGISSETVNTLAYCVNVASTIGSDFAVYFVTFIFMHCAIENLG